jgi:hypothetical protein
MSKCSRLSQPDLSRVQYIYAPQSRIGPDGWNYTGSVDIVPALHPYQDGKWPEFANEKAKR